MNAGLHALSDPVREERELRIQTHRAPRGWSAHAARVRRRRILRRNSAEIRSPHLTPLRSWKGVLRRARLEGGACLLVRAAARAR